jgi:tetratricopeptide (TPR) repeat protein
MTPRTRTTSPAMGTAAALALMAVLMVSAVGLEVARDRRYGGPSPAADVMYIRSGPAMAKIALSYRALLADVYWIRAIQHYGGTRRSRDADKRYDLLYPLLDVTTSLDPSFSIAYRFGAIFLAEAPPGGPGRPDQGIALLEKGLRASPDRWQYMQDIGFVYYWWLQDYEHAASWFERAAGVKGAPWFLKSLAAVTLAEGGDRQRSRLLWQELGRSEDNEWLRNNARLRLAQLDALDQIDQLEAVVETFERQASRRPDSWGALVAAGLLRGVPLDPSGAPYVLDPDTGRVGVSRRSALYPLPAEPASRPRRSPHA